MPITLHAGRSISLTVLALGAIASTFPVQASPSLVPFPQPSESQVRYVIQLPPEAHEQHLQVEVQVGKVLDIDCNHYAFGGELSEHHLPGWGYDYFVFSDAHPLMSTEKACTSSGTHPAFVQAADANRLLRYNSQLPMVIYTPKDMEVRYVLWRTNGNQLPAARR